MSTIDKIYSEQAKSNISKGLKKYYQNNKHHFFGKHHTKETKQKLSNAHKGKILSEEHKKKIGEASKEWHKKFGFTIEIKKKMSEARKGYKHSEETKRKISEANKDNTGGWNRGLTKKDPRVMINAVRAAKTLRQLYKEKKLKPWNLGIPRSEETKRKISAKIKGKTYEELMGKKKALDRKKRLAELGRMKIGKNNPMYGRFGEKNPHFGKPALHGKHSFKKDLGHHCRSKWEANYARYLLWTNKKYMYEPKIFEIKLPNGEKGTYTPDFLVENNEWHELKGWETRSILKKWQIFQEQYPNEKFVFIDRKKYKEIERLYKYIVPNWEF